MFRKCGHQTCLKLGGYYILKRELVLSWKREWKAGIFVAGKWKTGSWKETGIRSGLTQWVSDRNAEKSFLPIFLPQFSCLPFPDLGLSVPSVSSVVPIPVFRLNPGDDPFGEFQRRESAQCRLFRAGQGGLGRPLGTKWPRRIRNIPSAPAQIPNAAWAAHGSTSFRMSWARLATPVFLKIA